MCVHVCYIYIYIYIHIYIYIYIHIYIYIIYGKEIKLSFQVLRIYILQPDNN